jgi:SAM-dependent methyltransferase
VTDRPESIKISQAQFDAMISILLKNPTDLFLSEACRQYFALDRWQSSSKTLQFHDELSEGTMPGTIAHNRREVEMDAFGSTRRTGRLINPLSSLEPVYSHSHKLKALSIGPRTEMELLHLMGIGFQIQNIRALDLISSSPFIDAGDMHSLPYDDRSFDVVISGWAIAYSNRPQRAVDEMIRVCADGGLIAIGITFDAANDEGVRATARNENDIEGTNFRKVSDFEKLIGRSLHRVLFQQEPAGRKGPVMIIAQIKHTNWDDARR